MTEKLLSLIPHRPPFLFVDRVINISETEITTEKKVDPDEPFFKGHYPGNPIMPGVLICEAIFQSAAILVSGLLKNLNISSSSDHSKNIPVLARIKETKFKKMVFPGDVLTIKAKMIEKMGGAYFMKGEAAVDGKTAVRSEFVITKALIVQPPSH